jgi:hypothetical protein
VINGLLVVALPPVEVTEIVQCVGFVDPIANLAAQGQCLFEMSDGLLVATLLEVDNAQTGQCVGFGGSVTAAAGGVQGGAGDFGGIVDRCSVGSRSSGWFAGVVR